MDQFTRSECNRLESWGRTASIVVATTILLSSVGAASAESVFNQELAADPDGVVHLLIGEDGTAPRLSGMVDGAHVVVHREKEVRQSLQQAIQGNNYEVLDIEFPIEEFLKDAPLRTLTPGAEPGMSAQSSSCGNGQTVSTWWNLNGNPAKPNQTDSVTNYNNLIFQQSAHPWWNYVVFHQWGLNCGVEAYLTYNTASDTPNFGTTHWACNSTACPGHSVEPGSVCNANMSKATLLNGYVANLSDGTHTFPAVYAVLADDYVPNENPSYPYRTRVLLYRFSTSSWALVQQVRHNTRELRPASVGYERTTWIEYHYTHNNGPGCNGQVHPNFGHMGYWLCKVPYGTSSCQWHRPTSSSNSFVANDFSLPVTIQHVVPNYTFHVTKP